jgi:hypothetical protein
MQMYIMFTRDLVFRNNLEMRPNNLVTRPNSICLHVSITRRQRSGI